MPDEQVTNHATNTVDNLWIIMPVYNEEEALPLVIEEWAPILQKELNNYTFCIINDGSRDNTLQVLNEYQKKYPHIRIIDKINSGHGQTCIYGYKVALENNADWIFQIDSDGQCDPRFFSSFLKAAHNADAVFGKRTSRDDGLQRMVISQFVSIFTFVATGSWVQDANVPYRLIKADIMQRIVSRVPAEFYLANILISVFTHRQTKIKWIPICFRNRLGGTPSIKTFSFMKHGVKLFRQLKSAIKHKQE